MHGVFRFIPGANRRQKARHVGGVRDRLPVYAPERVADFKAGLLRGAAAEDVEGFDTVRPFHPRDAVFVEAEAALLLKIDPGSHQSGYGKDHKKGA